MRIEVWLAQQIIDFVLKEYPSYYKDHTGEDKLVHFALGKIIDQLREKGYEFVTVTVLLRESGVDLSLLEKR